MSKAYYLKLVDDVIKQGPYDDSWESLCTRSDPKWYKDAKLGIFIHWGVYSVPAFSHEWYSREMYIKGTPEYEHHIKTYGEHKRFGYKDFIPMFKGEKFNAEEWISLIKASGAKYVMPVSEHHDGFQMYDSELSAWNAKQMGPCRDVIGELRQAAEQEGIVFALSNHRAEHCWFFNGGLEYDSDVTDLAFESFYGKQRAGGGEIVTMDIHAFPPTTEHNEDWLARLCEIVEKYRPSIVYFDWWIHNVGFRPYLKKFAAYYYNRATEWGFEAAINHKFRAFPPGCAVLDVERGQLDGISPRIWQTCTPTSRNSWCYTENNVFKDSTELVCELVDIASKNGRMLLNIGPKSDGCICEEDRGLLLDIGDWLKLNGEAIHGTTHWEVFGEGPTNTDGGSMTDGAALEYTSSDIRFTQRGGNVYAFVMKYPADGKVDIPYLKKRVLRAHGGGDYDIKNVSILGYDIPVSYSRDENAMHITATGNIQTKYPVCFKITTFD